MLMVTIQCEGHHHVQHFISRISFFYQIVAYEYPFCIQSYGDGNGNDPNTRFSVAIFNFVTIARDLIRRFIFMLDLQSVAASSELTV